MLQLYPSNKTENLAFLIADLIKTKPLKKVFQEEIILIQSQGMGTWLQQELSVHNGISSQVKCQMPASFIWQLAETLMPEDRLVPLFEKNNLRWEVFRRLPEKLTDARYALLRRYLVNQMHSEDQQGIEQPETNGLSDQKTLFELAALIADTFDAYQNYRPDWLETWESGESVLDSNKEELQSLEAWQADLWCSLYPQLADDARQYRSKLLAKLLQGLTSPDCNLENILPERMFIFGLSALPPQWLPVIHALGRHIKIHFMVHNPCAFYWGDVLTPIQKLKLEQSLVEKGVSSATAAESFLEGNPLLASWGKLGRDYLTLLTDQQVIDGATNEFFDFDNTTQAGSITALSSIQRDVLNLTTNQLALLSQDDSLRFASCHSALREVEALHDYLFNLLNQHPDIKPKDIIVMTPDVQEFAPLIEAVFSRPAIDVDGQPQYLPYGISDQSLSSDQPLLDTLASLLELSSSRLTGADIMDLLDRAAIRSRFGISEEELEDIKRWIEHLNIRWGLSEEHRDRVLNMNGSGDGNTWISAAKRLMAGYLLGEEQIVGTLDAQVLAFPQRSPEKQILVGKFLHFLDLISLSIEMQSKSACLPEWLEIMGDFWHSWLDFDHVSEDIQRSLDQFTQNVAEESALTDFTEQVSYSVIASLLKIQFENERVSQRFLAGRINFCTLMPMRSIPFKVVCMLGMNEGSYPRQVQSQSFDLLTQLPARIGDRSRRDDDRYLFLEAICSARSHLYISYCGRDIQDNSERYPSVLVSELQQYCVDQFSLKGHEFGENETILKHILSEHHLQPFHNDYYLNASQTDLVKGVKLSDARALNKTFSHEWLALLNHIQPKPIEHPQKLEETVKLSSSTVYEEEQLDFFDEVPAVEIFEIDFEQVLKCLLHPLRYFYQRVLQINLNGLDENPGDAEPFSVKGLAAYALKKDILDAWFDSPSENSVSEELYKKWQLSGVLPRQPLDEFVLRELENDTEPMFQHLQLISVGVSESQEFVVRIDQYEVQVSLTTHGSQLISLGLSKNLANSFFSLWLKHVFWSHYCYQQDTFNSLKTALLIGTSEQVELPVLTADQASRYCKQICEFYLAASVSPHVFLAKTCYTWLFEGNKKALREFYDESNGRGESQDLYWQRFVKFNPLLARVNAPEELPDIEGMLLFQQLEEVKDQIKTTKLQTKEDASSPEASI